MFERFTHEARSVVIGAQEQARALSSEQIDPEHLLLGVLAHADSISARVLRARGVDQPGVAGEVAALGRGDDDALRALGIDLSVVRARAEAAFGPGALDRPRPRRAGVLRRMSGTSKHLRFSAAAKRALEHSLRQALDLRSGAIGVDHLLLGLLADDHAPAAVTLRRLGADPGDVRAAVRAAVQRAA